MSAASPATPPREKKPRSRMGSARRLWDPRQWPLAARVVVVTIVLSALAVATVGAYLSSVIADGLYEQRRDRILEESAEVRSDLTDTLRQLGTATTTQQQDAVTAFVQSVGGAESTSGREVALVPVDSAAGVFPAASDRRLFDTASSEFRTKMAAEPDALVWASVPYLDSQGREHPAILVGSRVSAPGRGTYDLFLVYSLQEEQDTLSFVQRVMLAGGLVLMTMLVGISVVIARIVIAPLQRAAVAAERISAGDLTARVEVSGADELARVGVSFNHMADTLGQKIEDLTELSRVQQRFVSDVSHELRTPLTTIRMASSVLDGHRGSFDTDLARTVELLSTQVERFDTLLADLLEISRFDAGAAVLDARRENLDDLVRHAVELVEPLAEDRGCRLELRLAGGDMDAVVDARRIDRIIRNLLTNAIEHGSGHPILVQTAAHESVVAVVVQDFGSGISPEDAARVFDRFWRADPSRARTLGGTGLGLSISVEDAHLHGGWLQAWGQVGQGAVFRLTLPRRPGGSIGRSPLPLQRPFDLALAGRLHESTVTGEIPIGPGVLPDFSTGPLGASPSSAAEEER